MLRASDESVLTGAREGPPAGEPAETQAFSWSDLLGEVSGVLQDPTGFQAPAGPQ